MDVAGYEWDRNRLLGTSKQRRNLRRVYRFAAVLDGDGVVDRAASTDIAARIGGGGDGVREVLPCPSAGTWRHLSKISNNHILAPVL